MEKAETPALSQVLEGMCSGLHVTTILAAGFSQMPAVGFRKFAVIPSFLRVLIMNQCQILFSASAEVIMVSPFVLLMWRVALVGSGR